MFFRLLKVVLRIMLKIVGFLDIEVPQVVIKSSKISQVRKKSFMDDPLHGPDHQ